MCRTRSKSLLLLFAGAIGSSAIADVIYVNANQTSGAHNGVSWTNAYQNLQEALASAEAGDEIWVAKSMPAQPAYFPSVRYPKYANDPNDPRRKTFRIRAGVKVYGGFRGYDDYTDPNHPFAGEPNLALRDPDHNLTILDGDLEQNDDPNSFPFGATFADNAYHVVFIHGTLGESITKLSGFVIRNGHADGVDEDLNPAGEIPDDMGGGVISLFPDVGLASEPRLDRLILDRNYADVAGAGILLAGTGGSAAPTNCRFRRNRVGNPGDSSLLAGDEAGPAVHDDRVDGATVRDAVCFEHPVVRGTGAGVCIPNGNRTGIELPNCTLYGGWYAFAVLAASLRG